MHYHVTVALGLSLAITTSPVALARSPLTVTAQCYENPSCLFLAKRLPIKLTVTNQSQENVFLTVDYMRKTGPYTTITDNDTGEVRYGHTKLGLDELLASYTKILPGASVDIRTILYESEISPDPTKRKCASITVEFDFYARWGNEEKKGLSFENKAILVIKGANREHFENENYMTMTASAKRQNLSKCRTDSE